MNHQDKMASIKNKNNYLTFIKRLFHLSSLGNLF